MLLNDVFPAGVLGMTTHGIVAVNAQPAKYLLNEVLGPVVLKLILTDTRLTADIFTSDVHPDVINELMSVGGSVLGECA